MTVQELRDILRDVAPEIQVMVQFAQNGPVKGMTAAQAVYFDAGGSRPVVVIDLYGHEDSSSNMRMKLGTNKGENS